MQQEPDPPKADPFNQPPPFQPEQPRPDPHPDDYVVPDPPPQPPPPDPPVYPPQPEHPTAGVHESEPLPTAQSRDLPPADIAAGRTLED